MRDLVLTITAIKYHRRRVQALISALMLCVAKDSLAAHIIRAAPRVVCVLCFAFTTSPILYPSTEYQNKSSSAAITNVFQSHLGHSGVPQYHTFSCTSPHCRQVQFEMTKKNDPRWSLWVALAQKCYCTLLYCELSWWARQNESPFRSADVSISIEHCPLFWSRSRSLWIWWKTVKKHEKAYG